MIAIAAGAAGVGWNAAFGIASGLGGLAVGWGMHRQALKDLSERFNRHEADDDEAHKQIALLTTTSAKLTEIVENQQKQMDRVNGILDQMASFPRGITG